MDLNIKSVMRNVILEKLRTESPGVSIDSLGDYFDDLLLEVVQDMRVSETITTETIGFDKVLTLCELSSAP